MKRREAIVVAEDSIQALQVLVGTSEVFEGFAAVSRLTLTDVSDKLEYTWVVEGRSV